jgi:hypothetical protein
VRFVFVPKLNNLPRRGIHFVAAMGAGLMLAACQQLVPAPLRTDSPTELSEAIVEFRIVPSSRAFINAPQALLVLERQLDGALEQRITLPNATSLAGENVILMRAQTERTASVSRLVLNDVLLQFGGPPTPFGEITDSALAATSDPYGDITYSVLRPGGDLTCVLAFRRTQTASRALPAGATALDIMMRNCVSGSLEAALAPLGAAAFGLGSPVFR